jgi:hypothetical protein
LEPDRGMAGGSPKACEVAGYRYKKNPEFVVVGGARGQRPILLFMGALFAILAAPRGAAGFR